MNASSKNKDLKIILSSKLLTQKKNETPLLPYSNHINWPTWCSE